MLACIVWLVLVIVIASVLVWALSALPLDATIKQIGRVAIIVIFVLMLVLTVLQCLGLQPASWPLLHR